MLIQDRLRKYIKSENTIKKAAALYELGCVLEIKSNSFWKSDVSVGASVIDSKNKYNCTITLSEGEITSYRCNCAVFGDKKEMCAHAGALYLKFSADKKSEKLVYTSIETRRIVNSYLERNAGRQKEKSDTNISLYTTAEIISNHLEILVYLKKGEKLYQINNLFEFERLFEKDGIYTYGRNFLLKHENSNFSEKSQHILEFIRQCIINEQNYCVISKNSHILIKNNKKIVISSEELDKYINILYVNSMPLHTGNGDFSISDSVPEIHLVIEKIGNSGYKVSIENIKGYICGSNTIYLLDEKHIYKMDDDFYKDMYVFIKGIFNCESNTLLINNKDMSSFCNGVLPILKEYCVCQMPEKLLDIYKPWELVCNFFAYLRDDKVFLKIESEYNNKKFDLFSGVCEDKNVCRDYNLEYIIKNIIEKYHFINTVNGEMMISDYEDIYGFLKHGVKNLRAFGQVSLDKNLLDMTLVDKMKIGASVSVNSNWLNLKIDAAGYSQRDLEILINSYREKKKYVKLDKNVLVKIDDNDLELLAGMAYDLDFTAKDLVSENIFVPRYRALYLDSRLSKRVSMYSKDAEFKTLVRTIKQVEDSEIYIPDQFKDILRDYQKNGYRWLKTMDMCGFGGILADDMGLGKTVQILALLADEYKNPKSNKKSLIIVPTSLIYNWENEIAKFAGDLKVEAVIGAKKERVDIINNSAADIFITSYELLKRDITEYENISFRYEILDEAQNIKNYTTNNAKAVKKIKAETRFALTGTPVENHLGELWSIFDFVMPGLLYTNRKFREKFELPIVKDNQKEAINGLKRMIAPFVLRREKDEVLKELPEKLEYNLYAKLTGEQHKLYTANAIKLRDELENDEIGLFSSNKISFLAKLTKLRQICCDPSLCYEEYEDGSAKLELCIDLIKNSVESGHKILLFSQFTSMLEIIAKRLLEENISFYTMTGSTKREERMTIVNKFNKDNTNVFLISLRVGGTGINLTSADIVIHYDPWWNVAVQNQATDRAHRIGQEKIVSVYKLIAKDTIEENIVKLQQSKEQLSKDIINGENISLSSLSRDELISILD